MFKLLNLMLILRNLSRANAIDIIMLAQVVDGCAICRLVAQCVDPQIALRDLQIALRDRQIAQIRRLRLTYMLLKAMYENIQM